MGPLFTQAQSFKIKMEVIGESVNVKLASIQGADILIFDSLNTDYSKELLIQNKNLYHGFYRIYFNDSLHYDFVRGCEDSITFNLDVRYFEKTFRIKENLDNSLLLSFKKEWGQLIRMHQTIQQIPMDDLSPEMKKNIEESIRNYNFYKNQLIDTYIEKFKCPLFIKLIRMNNTEYSNSIKTYFTDYLPMEDSSVIHTTGFNQALIDFYGKFGQFNQESFERLTDTILHYSNKNQQNYDFTMNYLFKLFSTVGPQSVFYFMIDNYKYSTASLDPSVKTKIEKYLQFKPGTNIQITNIFSGEKTSFKQKKIFKKNNYNLLIWWDPYCEHCREILPEINNQQWLGPVPQIITIALTENEDSWKTALEQLKIENLNNYIDTFSWESTNVKDLLIYKTPFFILVDNKGKIIAYDVNYPEIITFIK